MNPGREEREAFKQARRSVMLHPTDATDGDVRKFLIRKLQIMQDAVEDMTFQEIKKIYPKKSKDAKVYILIRLKSNHERDMIMSHASNLPKDCSIETVIPNHLSSLKSLLDGHAYKFRARARDEGGKVSTSVRLDELSNSLVLAVRKEKGNWRSYNQEELRLMEEESCLLYTSPSPRDKRQSRMPSSA